MNFDKVIWLFSKKSGRLSLAGPEILAFGSHCSAKFEPILDYCIRNSTLKYKDSENIKTNSVNTDVFNLHQIKQRNSCLGDPVSKTDAKLSSSV